MLESRDITLPTKVHIVKTIVFPVVLYGCESWTIKKARVVLDKTLESPLDCRTIKPVNLKGNQPWIFIGRTDADAPILWPPGAKSRPIGKDPGAGKDWGQEEKGTTKNEMVGWHHWLNGHGFEQTPGDSEGRGSLATSIWVAKRQNRNNREVGPILTDIQNIQWAKCKRRHSNLYLPSFPILLPCL